jgi:phenylacetate-coenzyme A ligase PaaK-like adenylate-forming protein
MSPFRAAQADRTLLGLAEFFGASVSETSSSADAELGLLQLFRGVARDVPAYRRFLDSHAIDPASIVDMAAFRRLPPTTKDNYYRQNPLADLCRGGRLEACDMLALSSGSTGEPAVWPRFVTDELATSARFEQVLASGFGAAERRTLAVICFALGNWVGGMYTLSCCRQLAAKGYPITVVSPGNNPTEILRALRALRGNFDQRVLFGYPPFIKDLIDLGQREGFDWSEEPTRLVLAGEVFSEQWRSSLCQRLKMADVARSTAALYGTADAGVLANETPLSVRIRRALSERPDVARALFGEARLPTLCQYDPRHRFFEAEGGWLLFSGDGGAPLIRYKILDRGGVVSHPDMLRFLASHGVLLEPDADEFGPALPFVYVFGRSQFAISFYGANVFPEHVAVGLEQAHLAARLTGKFVIEVLRGGEEDLRLGLTVELAPGTPANQTLEAEIAELVRRHLERQNSEFLSYVPSSRRTPEVQLRPAGDPEYFPSGVKHRYTRD